MIATKSGGHDSRDKGSGGKFLNRLVLKSRLRSMPVKGTKSLTPRPSVPMKRPQSEQKIADNPSSLIIKIRKNFKKTTREIFSYEEISPDERTTDISPSTVAKKSDFGVTTEIELPKESQLNLLPLPCFKEICLWKNNRIDQFIVTHNRTEIKYNKYQLSYVIASSSARAHLLAFQIGITFILSHVLLGILNDANHYKVSLKSTSSSVAGDHLETLTNMVITYYNDYIFKRLAYFETLLIAYLCLVTVLIVCSGFWCALINAMLHSAILGSLLVIDFEIFTKFSVLFIPIIPIFILLPSLIAVISWYFLFFIATRHNIMPSLNVADMMQDHHHHIVKPSDNSNRSNQIKLNFKSDYLAKNKSSPSDINNILSSRILTTDNNIGRANILNFVKVDADAGQQMNSQTPPQIAEKSLYGIRHLIYNHTKWTKSVRTHRTSVYLTIVHNLRWIFSDPKKLSSFNPGRLTEDLTLTHLIYAEKVALCQGFILALVLCMEMELATLALIKFSQEMYSIKLTSTYAILNEEFNRSDGSEKLLVYLAISVVITIVLIILVRINSVITNRVTLLANLSFLIIGFIVHNFEGLPSLIGTVVIFYSLFLVMGSFGLLFASRKKREAFAVSVASSVKH